MRVPSTQDWPPLDITFWSSDSDSEELEVVPAVMESEAVRLLAARIPPELFDDILFYVNVDRVSQCDEYNKGSSLRRNRGEPDLKDILTDLKRCSLVCLFWANRCREHMFSDGTLWIRSYEDAKIFRRYVVGGCPRLTPVHQLIGHIHITQNYSGILAPQDSERQTSFLHLLYLPAIQEKFKWLLIDGPVPEGFNSAKLDTPHWGIPPSMVVPGSFLQNEISLGDVHFPSFYHVTKYMRHFTCATSILFRKITWDGRTPTYSLPHISSTIACQRRPRRMGIRAGTGCTNPVNLALTAVMMNPNCPLHRLSDEDRVWIIKFMTLPWGHKADRDVWTAAGFDVSEQTKTMRLEPFSFVFEETPAPTDRSVSALSVVGMHAYIVDHSWRRLPANFDALVTHTRTHPTIRALVLLFDSSDRLQKSIKPFVEVLALATGTIELVLAYEEWKEPRAVGVDLATLEPNGRIWTDLPQSTGYPRYEDHPKSLHILRSQLKKKIRGSAH
ncbi:hypothetical protein BC629DRAFT_130016 [Irpex lacteus]|nr:hypothetical protein BC629DRAFT_130016 [Irpex lacteus]